MNHNDAMLGLKRKLQDIIPLLDGRDVHYVDIPMYGNIGDLLIMQGTLSFFKDNNIKIKSKCAYFNFDKSTISPNDVVVFQGGGNFGDLYPGPQQIRDYAVSSLKNRIIILPQTIKFNNAETYLECCNLYMKHDDLHIFTRDRRSLELAKGMSANSYLMPDMAHHLWPIQVESKNKIGKLRLIRKDMESSTSKSTNSHECHMDWPDLVGKREIIAKYLHKSLRVVSIVGLNGVISNAAASAWIPWANKLVAEAIDLFSRHESIETDRLHGHILSCLMSIPNEVIDNSYGKNSSYANEWTAVSDIVSMTTK